MVSAKIAPVLTWRARSNQGLRAGSPSASPQTQGDRRAEGDPPTGRLAFLGKSASSAGSSGRALRVVTASRRYPSIPPTGGRASPRSLASSSPRMAVACSGNPSRRRPAAAPGPLSPEHAGATMATTATMATMATSEADTSTAPAPMRARIDGLRSFNNVDRIKAPRLAAARPCRRATSSYGRAGGGQAKSIELPGRDGRPTASVGTCCTLYRTKSFPSSPRPCIEPI
jgi:hypothetical protein